MLGLSACKGLSPERAAQAYVDRAAELVEQHRYEAALQQIDSVHTLYPKQVAQRRQAKALKDSIVYLQAQQTLYYSDSILKPLLPEADRLLKEFRFEKNDNYEDHGNYVYRTLQTGWNTNRCFLQAYVATTSIAHSKPAGTPTAVSCKPMSPTTAKRFSRVITTVPNRYTRLQ